MNMKWTPIALLLLVAASSGGQESPAKGAILARMYDASYHWPGDFIKDPALTEVRPIIQSSGLQAATLAEARDKIKAAYKNRPAIKIDDGHETPYCFDFEADDATSKPLQKYRLRVDRSDFMKWNPRAWENNQRQVGSMPRLPADRKAAMRIAEFDWLVDYRQIVGAKVLKEDASEDDDCVLVVLLHAELAKGDWKMHDKINVVQFRYRVGKLNGEMTVERKVIKEVQGRLNTGGNIR